MEQFLTPEFWVAVGQIIMIDILLGGDNAVVIALACRKLPAHQRAKGIIWGTAGAIVLRVGNEGEGYEGIARGRIGVEGRPVLADREGAFGNPTADSLRTSVTHATSRALVVLYLPPTVERPNVERLLDATSRTVTTHCGGRESARRIVP